MIWLRSQESMVLTAYITVLSLPTGLGTERKLVLVKKYLLLSQ
jgi:hypothetical protein